MKVAEKTTPLAFLSACAKGKRSSDLKAKADLSSAELVIVLLCYTQMFCMTQSRLPALFSVARHRTPALWCTQSPSCSDCSPDGSIRRSMTRCSPRFACSPRSEEHTSELQSLRH